MDYNEYDYSSQQWDVDRVKLEFKSGWKSINLNSLLSDFLF